MARLQLAPLFAVPLLAALACDRPTTEPPETGTTGTTERALSEPDPKADPYGDEVDELVHLDQGWSAEQRRWFYTASQGSRIMPYAIFMALERAEDETRLAAPHNLKRYRWLTDYEGAEQNHGLPLGFARDGEHVGLTCSACHTAQINYAGKGIRVDGGPAMANAEAFLHAITEALAATLAQPEKFDRFAAAVLDDRAQDEAAREQLRAQLEALHAERSAEDEANRASQPYGFARVDAFGRIFNRAMRMVDGQNGRPATAPVSFPVLWDTPHHDYVQWNAFAANAGTGAIQRNVGQLIGVFGELELELGDPRGYPSSVKLPELIRMEQEIAKLQSPRWPEAILGELDAAKLEAGEALYKNRCEACHARIDRADPERTVTAQMIRLEVVGTDPTAARNIVEHAGLAGPLAGKKDAFADGQTIGEQALAMQVVGNFIGGVIQYAAATDPKLAQQLGALAQRGELRPRQGKLANDPKNPLANLLAYKARPLNGVWSSAPYLHNGSVPTLHDLLLPPEQRPATFHLGRFEFDPAKVGFVSDPFEGAFEFDTRQPGNANVGHLYGTDLADDERAALLEYLKSL